MPRHVTAALLAAIVLAVAPGASAATPAATDAQRALATHDFEWPIDRRLAAIRGLTVVDELPSSFPDARLFTLTFEQPADHQSPQGERFQQRLTLLHRDPTAPTILANTGYTLFPGLVSTELGEALQANVLFVEQRFFGPSVPASRDWTLLNIRQAANDHHRLVEAFKRIYHGRWLSEGGSKGGMASVYHRYFFPRDVHATVPYVAPVSHSPADPVSIGFIDTRGTPECRARIDQFGRILLLRRAGIEPILARRAQAAGLTYDFFGLSRAFEIAVVDFAFVIWQYFDASLCDAIPDAGASDETLADFFNDVSGFLGSYDDGAMEFFAAYFYQAATELGGPAPREAHLLDLLTDPGLNQAVRMPPFGVPKPFTEGLMERIERWVLRRGRQFIFLYGENDPWGARMYAVAPENDSYRFVVEDGNHLSSLGDLPEAEQQVAEDALERWLRLDYELDIPSSVPDAARRRTAGESRSDRFFAGARPGR
jgi:hypothetical protein